MMCETLSISAVAAERPDAVAVDVADRPASMTYRELERASHRVATGLRDQGIGPGDRIGIALDAGIPFVVTFHAANRLGAVAAPVAADRSATSVRERLDRIGPSTVVAMAADAPPERAWDVVEYPALAETDPAGELGGSTDRSPDATACLVCTSGTTGQPRVVMLSRRNLIASALASAFRLGVTPGDRWLTPLAPHHMGGLAPIVRSAVYGTTYVPQSFDTESVSRTLREDELSGISLVPVMLRRLLAAEAPLADLRFVLVGGDRTPPALVRRSLSRDIALYVSYGMTETASQIATATPAELRRDPETVGRPLRWTGVTIDPDDQEAPGEIVVTGPTVANGYWRDPARTDERFGPTGLRTGDEGRLTDDGRLMVSGRRDERIVTGGETVDPVRVREALEAHTEVREAAVVGVPDEEWGERVGAMVATENPSAVGIDREALRTELGNAAVPRIIAAVERLPRTVSGTIDRQAVREQLRRQAE